MFCCINDVLPMKTWPSSWNKYPFARWRIPVHLPARLKSGTSLFKLSTKRIIGFYAFRSPSTVVRYLIRYNQHAHDRLAQRTMPVSPRIPFLQRLPSHVGPTRCLHFPSAEQVLAHRAYYAGVPPCPAFTLYTYRIYDRSSTTHRLL